MKTILKQLKNYIKETILGPLFKLFEAILELLVPLIVSLIIDKGINDGINTDKKLIIISFVGLLLIALVGFIFAIIAQYFSAKAAVGVSSGMRRELYSKIHSLSFKDLDESGTSSLITRMTSDINQVQTGVNLTLRLFLRSPIIVFGAMIMSFTISLKFAFIFISVIIALLVVVLGIMFICIPLYEKAQEKLDKITLSTRENLVGARVIRTFTKEDEEIELFKERNRDLTKLQKVIGTISGLMNPLTFVIVNVAIIILLNKGAISIEMGDLTQGQVLALYNYLSIILIELVKLANLIITINKALACSNRIEKVLSKDISLKFDNSSKENVPYISFENVSMKYHEKSNEALKNINLSINKGETVGIIGGTGSGKSSLINLLPHLYDYSEGDIYLEGKSIRSYELTTLRDKFGVVPQKSVLFKGTIKENLTWRKKNASEEEILEAVKIAQAEDVILSKDRGLNSLVEQGGSNFSGGQKQRLCIARALVGNPEILILDDSSSALDYATDKKLRMSLKQLDYKPTTIIVSQRTSAISHADKIVVLDKGEIVGIGTHDDLLKTCRVYQEIHFSQTKKEVY